MVAWIARVLTGVLSLKTFMSGALMVVLGIILYNLAVDMIEEVMIFALAQINGASYGTVTSPTISGFAGWFMAQLKFPECVAVIVTCVSLRFILRKIPFIRW